MNEMIERVADQIAYRDAFTGTREQAVIIARAAIEAMREPGESVMRAGATQLSGANVAGRTYRVWQSMIDAALK